MTAIEDLIAENQATFNADLVGARAQPRDEAATSDLKGDSDKMAKLAELAEVKPEDVVDCAVRGTNVSFQVKDADGVVSPGFFPLASLEGRATKAKRESGTVQKRGSTDPAPKGGAATVPTVVSTDGDTVEPGDDPPVPPPEGVPADIDGLSGDKVAELLKDTPEGVDADAVLAHEFAREGGPRTAVTRAAQKLGKLNEDGSLKTDEGAPPA